MKAKCFLLAAAMTLLLLSGCGSQAAEVSEGDAILATTYPVYYLTRKITDGVGQFQVEQMITEQVSCLHDYTLTTEQMKKVDRADVIVKSGAGLEDFMNAALKGKPQERIIDSSVGIELIDGDPHIWMDPERYAQQGINIAEGLGKLYPEYAQALLENARLYQDTLLHEYEAWKRHLSDLSEREMVTFHDGFAYFADAFDLTILAAIEEEEGAEPSAAELEEICRLVREHNLKSIFVETNGSTAAAEIVSKETGVLIGELNLIMSHQGYDYIEDMYKNVYEVKADLEWHTS